MPTLTLFLQVYAASTVSHHHRSSRFSRATTALSANRCLGIDVVSKLTPSGGCGLSTCGLWLEDSPMSFFVELLLRSVPNSLWLAHGVGEGPLLVCVPGAL